MAGALSLDLAGDAVAAARALIGWTVLVDGVGGPIVETEGYRPDDPASHAFAGPTARNEAMFGPPGTWYVYRSYGIHWCMNIVCGPPVTGSAVLLRALEPVEGVERMRERRGREALRDLARGPGRLGQALAAGPHLNGMEVELVAPQAARQVMATPRIGISRATDLPWRFLDPASPYVSGPRPVAV